MTLNDLEFSVLFAICGCDVDLKSELRQNG